VKHHTTVKFWAAYRALPQEIRVIADRQFAQLKTNPRHPSLQFKKLGSSNLWSARVNQAYRALAVESDSDFVWFWIGDHATYEKLIK
jgi:hypothetical protein